VAITAQITKQGGIVWPMSAVSACVWSDHAQ